MSKKKKVRKKATYAMLKHSKAREIEWATRIYKRRNDQLLGYYLHPLLTGLKPSLRMLSLPAKEWIFEKFLADLMPSMKFEFVGLEHDPKLASVMIKQARSLSEHHTNAVFLGTCDSVKSYLKEGSARDMADFDIIYLDYMGPWSNDRKVELDLLLKGRRVNRGGYLILTLSLNRTQPHHINELRDYAAGDHDIMVLDDRRDQRSASRYAFSSRPPAFATGVACWIQRKAEEHGVILRAFPPHIYYNLDGRSPSPELSLCFVRTS